MDGDRGIGPATDDELPVETVLPVKTLSEHVRRGALFNVACPSRDVLKHVTSRWGVLVLLALMLGTHRFAELRRRIGGVSEKMLAQTLQMLEADGLVERHARPVVPPHVEYSLTDLGREAGTRVAALADWIEISMPEIMGRRLERQRDRQDAAE